jgi:hypothetical protein
MKMVMACLGRLNGAQGRLVARWLGQRCWFHKWDMPMACQVTREGERGRLASRFFRGGQEMWDVHDIVSVEIDKEGQQQDLVQDVYHSSPIFSSKWVHPNSLL